MEGRIMRATIERLLALQALHDRAWHRAYAADDFHEYDRIMVRIRAASKALADFLDT